jgi:hypothetical protein
MRLAAVPHPVDSAFHPAALRQFPADPQEVRHRVWPEEWEVLHPVEPEESAEHSLALPVGTATLHRALYPDQPAPPLRS